MNNTYKLNSSKLKLKGKRRVEVTRRTLKNKKHNLSKLMTYAEFVKSTSWHFIKQAWYKKYLKDCKRCNSHEDIHLHHIIYPNLNVKKQGAYRNVYDKHFISLCSICHKQYHDDNGTYGDMVHTSIGFLGDKRWASIWNRRNKKKTKLFKLPKKQTKERSNMSVSSLLSL